MNASEKRAAVVAAYKIILGRNLYSQDAAKRECCFTPYKDGKHYSDCSSSIRLAHKRAGIGLDNIGSNTVGMYLHKAGVKVECGVKNGIPTDVSKLRVGDILLYAGNDPGRAYADFVGHVEMVYSISGNVVTLCGHGDGTPSTKEMVSYCKKRQATKADTKKGNRSLLKVVRFIPDDKPVAAPSEPTKEPPKQPGKIRVTGSSVNVRKGPGTSFEVAMTVKQGSTFDAVDINGWVPILVNGTVLWVSRQYAEEVR